MKIYFYKYQGAGNDFVIIDNRLSNLALNTKQIAWLCDRRFGIGADGLMLLENAPGFDFKMVYYNSDGNESTMCGNGGRCIVAFAACLGIINNETLFTAIDGAHKAFLNEENMVTLQMQNIDAIDFEENATILNTGSPHYVVFVNDTDNIDVAKQGRDIRNQQRFQPNGINVNFVENINTGLKIRTYERGVEDETLACGTGVTAAAIASVCTQTGHFEIDVKALGGDLKVVFDKTEKEKVENIWLTGSAEFVFEGSVSIL